MSMCKKINQETQVSVKTSLAALILLTVFLLSAHSVFAQADQIAGGTGVNVQVAHVNNVITIKGVDASESLADNGATVIAGWLVKPDNSNQLVFTNGTSAPGQCLNCPSGFIPLCNGNPV